MKKLLYLVTLLSIPALSSAQSLSLEQCIDLALKNSYELKNSNIDAEIAKQIKKEAFTKYFPSVSATGATFRANEYMIDENIDLTKVGQILAGMGMNPAQLGIPPTLPLQMINNGTVGLVTATQPLFTGGQIINGNKLASVGSEVSNLKTILTENEVISKTENYFWQIVSLKEKLKTLDFADKQLEEYHRTVSAAVNSGLTNRNDLLKIELEQQKVASNRIKVDNGIKVYKLMLCNLTGSQIDGFDINASEFPAIVSPSEFYVSSEEGMTARTENKLLDKSVEAATLQHRMAIGKNMPLLAAGAGYMYHNLMDRDVNMGLVFATISVPISSWWGGSHEIRQSRYNEIKTENERTNMQQLMKVDIESKWSQLTESYLQIQVAQKSIDVATENLKISGDYYNAGTVSLTDLLNAETLLQQSRDQYTDACTSYFIKLLTYKQSTGK